MFRPWHERVRTGVGVAVFYGLLAVVVMSPMAAKEMPLTGAMDLGNHLSGIIEAGNALEEGQFPVRVAPHQLDQARYPIFQFYGNLPYTLGGILYLAGVDPYHAWKVVVWAALVLGAFFLYRCARQLTRQFWPAVVAGAVFLTAPYTLTDLHGRVAYSELISLCLLPVVYFYLDRTFATGRWTPILLGALAWYCLALTHNVTFFVASQLFPLFLLMQFRRTRRYFRRLLAVGLSYGLALGLAAWYIAPQLYLLDNLAGGLQFPLKLTNWLTPLGVLLAPRVMPPVPLPTNLIFHPGQFGIQVGWVILAGVFVCAHGWYTCRFGQADRKNAGRLLLLFALTFVLVWSPFDFWQYLPPIYQFIQFSYRLLMFVVLFGSLLAALALKLYFARGMRYEHAVACLLGVGAYLGWSLEPHRSNPRPLSVTDEIADPNIGRGGANGVYRLSLQACLENMRRDPMPPGYNYARSPQEEVPVHFVHGHPVVITLQPHEPRFVGLPVLYYPKVLDVRLNGRRVHYRNLGEWVAVTVPAGEHEITIRFAGLRWANWLSAVVWGGVVPGLVVVSCSAWRRRRALLEAATLPHRLAKDPEPTPDAPYLSLIIPAYNEVRTLGSYLATVRDHLDRQAYRYEIIVVADGDDGTREMVGELARHDPRLSVLGSADRGGKGRGIRHGVARARGALIGFIDADGKTPIEELDKLLPWFDQGHDLVIGSRGQADSRIEVPQPLHRRLGSRAFGIVMHLLVGLWRIRDTQCGFKFFRAAAARDLFARQRIDGYMFDVEVLYLAQRGGYRIKEVGVRWRDDGDSRLRLVSGNWQNMIDLLRIRFGKNLPEGERARHAA